MKVLAWLFGLLIGSWCWAAVLELDFAELARKSELIFEGEVIDREVAVDPRTRLPWTKITFAVFEVLKGSSSDRLISLYFLGGQAGNLRLLVPEIRYPKLGEHGIYFVRDPEVRYANPLTGWSQGHFLIEEGRVFNAYGNPVVDIDSAPKVRKGPKIATGTATGVVVSELKLTREAMTVEAFRRKLQESLAR